MPVDLEVQLEAAAENEGPAASGLRGVAVVATDDGLQLLGGPVDPPSLDVAAVAEGTGFGGRRGQSLVLRPPGGGGAVVLLGLGSSASPEAEDWRRAGAALVRAAGEADTAGFDLPAGTDAPAVAAFVEGAALATYHFDEFRTRAPQPTRRLVLRTPGPAGNGAQGAVERGLVVARAVGFARDLINTPPSDLPPVRLAEKVLERAEGVSGVSVEVWDEGRITAERLGALLGVSRGSAEPPRLVKATYVPEGETDRHLVLVGKGITFDSGGLSLKTAEGMTTMKTDMSGAAAVLAALLASAELGLGVRVTALAPVTENMPGGRAMKPGDVLVTRSGTTIEVLNTDAEGRLVLADALTLATELEPAPDAIVDVATLTGAAKVALGNDIGALFANDDDLAARVEAAGRAAGEPLWRLPLPEQYAEHLDSEVADLKNTGRPGQAGAIAAALLLARFVGDVPWAHLDIAGPGRSGEAAGYLSKGGTAFGARTLVELAASYGPPSDVPGGSPGR